MADDGKQRTYYNQSFAEAEKELMQLLPRDLVRERRELPKFELVDPKRKGRRRADWDSLQSQLSRHRGRDIREYERTRRFYNSVAIVLVIFLIFLISYIIFRRCTFRMEAIPKDFKDVTLQVSGRIQVPAGVELTRKDDHYYHPQLSLSLCLPEVPFNETYAGEALKLDYMGNYSFRISFRSKDSPEHVIVGVSMAGCARTPARTEVLLQGQSSIAIPPFVLRGDYSGSSESSIRAPERGGL
jgi:hypothetical protein